MNDELDFKWKNHGPFCTLDPQSERAHQFIRDGKLEGLAFEHDDLLRVEIELNKHGYTIKELT